MHACAPIHVRRVLPRHHGDFHGRLLEGCGPGAACWAGFWSMATGRSTYDLNSKSVVTGGVRRRGTGGVREALAASGGIGGAWEALVTAGRGGRRRWQTAGAQPAVCEPGSAGRGRAPAARDHLLPKREMTGTYGRSAGRPPRSRQPVRPGPAESRSMEASQIFRLARIRAMGSSRFGTKESPVICSTASM